MSAVSLRCLLLCSLSLAGCLALLSCRTDDAGAARERKLPLSAPASFDVMAAAVPLACCPVCDRISLSVRNPGADAVDIDWSSSRMEHNGTEVKLPLEGDTERRGEATISTLAPGATWTGVLRPEPGAPNASSLEEGKLRNGTYTFHLLVLRGDTRTRATTTLKLEYDQQRPHDDNRVLTAAACEAER